MKVLHIPYNSAPKVVEIPDAGDTTAGAVTRLSAMQELVNGMIEPIPLYQLPAGMPSTELWANEEAMYVCIDLDENGKPVPQTNDVATIIARRFAPHTLLGGGAILGNAFLTGGCDEDGETLPVSDRAIRLVQEITEHVTREKEFSA